MTHNDQSNANDRKIEIGESIVSDLKATVTEGWDEAFAFVDATKLKPPADNDAAAAQALR